MFITVALGAAALAAACGDDASDAAAGTAGAGAGMGTAGGGADSGSGAGNGGDGGAGTTYSSGVGEPPTELAYCGGKLYECGDLIDNDGDGFLDAQDVDCLGPCDNTEDSYYPDLPGMTGADCKVDCFWDNGNGSGNDDCYWDHLCDPLEVGPDFPPEQGCAYDPEAAKVAGFTCEEAYEQQSQQCYDYCRPLVPNGCDCFGCCELPAGSGEFVWLGSYDDDGVGTCTLADIGDPTKCKPCTFVPGCGNPCDPCEVCIGKPDPGPECGGGTGGGGGAGGGGGGSQCQEGVQPCGLEGQDPCAAGYYCITGCCVLTPD